MRARILIEEVTAAMAAPLMRDADIWLQVFIIGAKRALDDPVLFLRQESPVSLFIDLLAHFRPKFLNQPFVNHVTDAGGFLFSTHSRR